jgi:hypothetical protein
MPDQLTLPRTPATAGDPAGLRALLPAVRDVVLILVLLVAAGALAGLVWVWWWTPPTGTVVHHHWVQDERGLRGSFSGTGTYVTVAALAGILAGGLAAVLFDRIPLVTLVAVVAGSLVAGWLMYRVGLALSPDDPRRLAASAEDGTRLPARLVVSGMVPRRVLPAGALLGLVVVMLGLARHRAEPDASPERG